MTAITNWYTVDNKPGVNLNNVVTSVSITTNPPAPEYPLPPFALGDRCQGNAGSEWIFVRASATVTAYNLVAIGPAPNFSAVNLTSALVASNAYTYGIAEFQPTAGVTAGNATGGVANAGECFWALLKANAGVRLNTTVSLTIGLGTGLYISGTAGFVAASASGSSRLNGLVYAGTVSIDASSATYTALEVNMFSYILPGILVSATALSA